MVIMTSTVQFECDLNFVKLVFDPNYVTHSLVQCDSNYVTLSDLHNTVRFYNVTQIILPSVIKTVRLWPMKYDPQCVTRNDKHYETLLWPKISNFWTKINDFASLCLGYFYAIVFLLLLATFVTTCSY